jgi:hypothetical protein
MVTWGYKFKDASLKGGPKVTRFDFDFDFQIRKKSTRPSDRLKSGKRGTYLRATSFLMSFYMMLDVGPWRLNVQGEKCSFLNARNLNLKNMSSLGIIKILK